MILKVQPHHREVNHAQYRAAVIGRTGQGNYGHGLDVVWKVTT
ncbi:MAG: hypothetical protein NZT92_13355 [Abditibacteriales bacterium]|nr:hypothetical protein [Abditibacteriales bacterium]